MKEVTLTLTIEEAKKVMTSLSKNAWVEVNDLIVKINKQIMEQENEKTT